MSTPFCEPADQLGCVVPDLPAAISEWAAEGVGPFLTMRGITLADYRYKGRPSKPKIDVAFSQQGEMQVELIHPVNDRPSAYRDFLAAGGHGAHHHGWFWPGTRPRAPSLRPPPQDMWSCSRAGGVRFTSSTTSPAKARR